MMDKSMSKKLTVKQTADFLKQNDNFIVVCHANPDGDTLGSGYGLCGALHVLGKRAKLVCDDKPSSRFDFLLETLNLLLILSFMLATDWRLTMIVLGGLPVFILIMLFVL